jgi:methylated-DNA-protein-cysteine methyltransferase related protein
MGENFNERVIRAILSIPPGKVATYGQIALLAGSHRASRQVAGILKRYSKKYGLPWFRVINSRGKISLPRGEGFEEQQDLLREEGIEVKDGKIALSRYLWNPGRGFSSWDLL